MSGLERALPPEVEAMLARLAELPIIGKFALGGGTAIALRIPYRRSVDLDWFTTEPFDSLGLQYELTAGLGGISISNRTQGSLRFTAAGTKAEFFHHPYPLLKAVEKQGQANLLSLDDLAAMKVNAVTNRGSKKDFSDLLALHEHGLSLDHALSFFCRKYGPAGRLLAVRSLIWFEDSEGEPDPWYLNGWTWKEVRSRFEGLARELLG